MSRPRTRGKTLIERIRTHYGCSYIEAQLRLDSGNYDLPKLGARREQPEQRSRSITGRAAVTAVANNAKFASLVLGALGAVFGTMSLLVRLFEGEEG